MVSSSAALSRRGSVYSFGGGESSPHDLPSHSLSPPRLQGSVSNARALDDDQSHPGSGDDPSPTSDLDTDSDHQPFDYRSLLRPMNFGSRRPPAYRRASGSSSSNPRYPGPNPASDPPAATLASARAGISAPPPFQHTLSGSSGTPLSGPEPAASVTASKRPRPRRQLSFGQPPGLLPVDAHRRRRHRRRARVILTPRGNNHVVNGGGGLKMTGVEWSGKTLVAVEQEMEKLGKREWMSYSPDPDYLARRLEVLRKNLEAEEREDEWRAQQGFGPLYQNKRWIGPDYPSSPPPADVSPKSGTIGHRVETPSRHVHTVATSKSEPLLPSLPSAANESTKPTPAAVPSTHTAPPEAANTKSLPALGTTATRSQNMAMLQDKPPSTARKSTGRGFGFLKVNDTIENAVPHAPMISPPATPERAAVALGSDLEEESQRASSSTPEDYEMTNALSQFHLRPPTVLTQAPASASPFGTLGASVQQGQEESSSRTSSPHTPPALASGVAPAPPPTQAFSQWGATSTAVSTGTRTAEQRAKAERAAQLAHVASADADRLYKALPQVDYASQREALQQRVAIRDARRPDLEQVADLHCLFGELDDQPDEDPLFLNRDNHTTSATFLLRLLVDENYVAVVAVAKPLPEPSAPIFIPRFTDPPNPFHHPSLFQPTESAILEAPGEEELTNALSSTGHTKDSSVNSVEPHAPSAPIDLDRRRNPGSDLPSSSSLDSDQTQGSGSMPPTSSGASAGGEREKKETEEPDKLDLPLPPPSWATTSYAYDQSAVSLSRPSGTVSPIVTSKRKLRGPEGPGSRVGVGSGGGSGRGVPPPGPEPGPDALPNVDYIQPETPKSDTSESDQTTDRPKSAAGGLLDPVPEAGDAIPGPEYLAPPPLQRVMATPPPRYRPLEREIILGVASAIICYHPPPLESFDLPHGEAGGPGTQGLLDPSGMGKGQGISDDLCSTIHVLTLSVLSTERHQGLGAWLLDTLLERAQERLIDQHRLATRWQQADRERRQAQSSTPSTRRPSRAASQDRLGQRTGTSPATNTSTAAGLTRVAEGLARRSRPRIKAYLEVHPSNTRACALYERVGFHRTSTERGFFSGDRRIPSRIRLTPGGQDAVKYQRWL